MKIWLVKVIVLTILIIIIAKAVYILCPHPRITIYHANATREFFEATFDVKTIKIKF